MSKSSTGEIDADRVVVYESTTVDVNPEHVDEDWLAERYDGDYIEAKDRVAGEEIGEAGDLLEPDVCPACGEECRAIISIRGTRYYSHTESDGCERDASRCHGSNSEMISSGRMMNLLVGWAVGTGFVFFIVRELPFKELAAVPNPDVARWVGAVFLVVIALLFLGYMTVGPRPNGGGRR